MRAWFLGLLLSFGGGLDAVAADEGGSFFGLHVNNRARRVGNWWDADIQFGLGHQWAPESQLVGTLGGRVGLVRVSEPWFLTAGLAVQWPAPDAVAIGVQFEVTHLWSGMWFQPGVALRTDGAWMASATAGFSVVGVEFRASDLAADAPQLAVLARIRIPIGLLVMSAKK